MIAVLLLIAVVFLAPVPAAAEPPAGAIRFGIQIAPEDTTYEELVETARMIEELGYDSIWLNDHFIPSGNETGSQLEAWTLLAALATQTERIRLGILVTGNTYRHPAVLAKMATTVDHVSGGRLEFGIGAGWQEREHRAYGIPFYTAKERAERLGEALEVVTRLWRDRRSTFAGEYYQLDDAPFSPRPLQRPHPPIVVGGKGKKWIMPLVGRYADEWTASTGVSPAGIEERMKIVRRACERAGRTECVRDVSVFLPLANITGIPLAGALTRIGARLLYSEDIATSLLAGSADDIRTKIRTYADAGVTRVIITTRPSIDRDLMRRFAEEVMASF